MDCEIGKISLRDAHAIEETIRYLDENSNPTYNELVNHLSWYFNRNQTTLKFENECPKGWILDWIRALIS